MVRPISFSESTRYFWPQKQNCDGFMSIIKSGKPVKFDENLDMSVYFWKDHLPHTPRVGVRILTIQGNSA